MFMLAFDTCFGACSAAVFAHRLDASAGTDGWPQSLASCDEPMAVGHAERLMPMIAQVMSQAGLSFSELQAIAVTIGPGTFTGVRTGIAAARGLALASGLPVLGTSSLALIARRAAAELGPEEAETQIAVCMDAGKGQLYAQLFGIDSTPICEPMLTTAEHVSAMLAPGSSTVVGSAAGVVAELAAERGIRIHARHEPCQPSARYLQGIRLQSFSPVRPLYLRQPDAVPQADKALPRANP